MSAPAPIRIFRDPTKADVLDRCDEIDCELIEDKVPGGRDFFAVGGPDGGSTYLGYADTGERPDWRAMLQKLGSDWA